MIGNAQCFNSHTLNLDRIKQTVSASSVYLFTEASSPQVSGSQASLLSPILPFEDVCLSFYYNMYGAEMGTLEVTAEVRITMQHW